MGGSRAPQGTQVRKIAIWGLSSDFLPPPLGCIFVSFLFLFVMSHFLLDVFFEGVFGRLPDATLEGF